MSDLPTWEGFMSPTLQVLSDGAVRTRRELCPLVAHQAQLTDDDVKAVLSSGQLVYENRIGWGLSFLTNVGALDRPSRGSYAITKAGRQLLERMPDGFRERDVDALGEDPSSLIRPYVATGSSKSGPDAVSTEVASMTPTEQVVEGVTRIQAEVAAELVARLQGKEPGFFERAVVDLLLAMGYAGAHGKGATTPLSNDGGIDGVIDQDALGLNKVYLQAKRYAPTNPVGKPEVQGFVGALSGKADGGIFITTSRFSDGAKAYAEAVPMRIILIDGNRLADLMIRYGVGVQVRETHKIVEIDEDFFA